MEELVKAFEGLGDTKKAVTLYQQLQELHKDGILGFQDIHSVTFKDEFMDLVLGLSDTALDVFNERVVPKLGQLDCMFYDFMAQKLRETLASNTTEGINEIDKSKEKRMETLLVICRAAKSYNHELDMGDLIKQSLYSGSKLKKLAFACITESRQTVGTITNHDLELVKLFLVVGLDGGVEPRKQMTSLLAKFLQRVKRCLYKHGRDIHSLNKKLELGPDPYLESKKDQVNAQITEKLLFFEWIQQFAV